MENALLVGLSRQMALTHELDVIANNIANIDTTGYKSDNAMFEEYLMPRASDQNFTGQDRRIRYVEDRASWIDMSQGAVEHTGNPLDVAINGNGYLVVQTPNGQQRYTRNGALSINASGQLVTDDGDQVIGDSGPITFQSTDHDVTISRGGIITVREGSSTANSPRGNLQLVNFAQPQLLQKDGGSTFAAPAGVTPDPAPVKHVCGSRRDREIKRERRRRDGANDRDHAQLHRYRQRAAATKRAAPQRTVATVADAEFVRVKVRETVRCVRLILRPPEWRPWTFRSRSSPAISQT